ncbi:MAG: oligosaccharide repeat unit polymerase [Novosphingobium sp.]|nr:oligosaccharide repeat unit polymerase [Novosphingobium sp.]
MASAKPRIPKRPVRPINWPRPNSLRRVAYYAFILFIVASMTAIVGSLVFGVVADKPEFLYLSAAILMSAMPILIGFSRGRNFDLFEPINVAAAAIFFGTTARAFYLIFASHRQQAKFLMMQQTFEDINSNIIWIVLGVALFCVGYSIQVGRFKLERVSQLANYSLNRERLNLALLACLALTLIGAYSYARYFGISLADNIFAQSYKRTFQYVNDSGEIVRGAGWQFQFAQIALFGAFVLIAALFAQKIRLTFYSAGLLAALLLAGSYIPFISQSRTPIILLLFNVCVIGYYYKRLSMRSAVVGVLLIAMIVSVMGTVRNENSGSGIEREGALDMTVGSGNGFDAVRSTAIITRMRERQLYMYGASYAAIPFSVIPRAVWPGKPKTALGQFVKRDLFNKRAEYLGWPPGFVAEAFINFGYIGILFIPFFIGIGTRAYYETFRPLLGVSFPITVVYVALLYRLAFSCIELNLAQGVVSALVILIPVGLILVGSGNWVERRDAARKNPARVRQSPRARFAQDAQRQADLAE